MFFFVNQSKVYFNDKFFYGEKEIYVYENKKLSQRKIRF